MHSNLITKKKKKIISYIKQVQQEEFKKETERGPYQYQPDNGEDDDDARLSFIKYMTGEKGYHYAKGEQHANHN